MQKSCERELLNYEALGFNYEMDSFEMQQPGVMLASINI